MGAAPSVRALPAASPGSPAERDLAEILDGGRSALRRLDRIWRVRGRIDLPRGATGDDAFGRLDPLLRQPGDTCERTGDTLVFRKQDPAAQDKLAVFDAGVLSVEPGGAGLVLRYCLTSRTLLFCFLAPLLFLAFAQATIALSRLQRPPTAAEKARQKAAEKRADVPLNPIDKALGAPAPEKHKAKKAGKADDHEKKKLSPTPAYVFAGIFAALYLIGRVLEDRLVRRLFKRSLLGG